MNDKIYRRVTQPSGNPKTTMKKNVKNRKRSMIMNFRVTPEEKELIEARIKLSGLSKETFFIDTESGVPKGSDSIPILAVLVMSMRPSALLRQA